MTSTALDTIQMFVGLGIPERRVEASGVLARRCGAEEMLVLVRDPELDALLPAPGFPQTLKGGPSWREFLRRCATPGQHRARVELPPGTWRPALALVADGLAAVMVGGTPVETEIAMVEHLLPMLSHGLRVEQQARFASEAEADARDIAARANALAEALESSRAEHARLNARLHEEHRRKDEFLAMLAHELRNPLTPLVTSIELLRRAGAGETRHLEVMGRQVRQLSRLVEDLLDVSRVNSGRIELRKHRLNLVDTVSDAIESSRPLLEGRRHEIRLALPTEAVPVDGDSVRLGQVFANLLHNAGKYTDPGGRIAIEVGRDEEQATVRISDTGIGIEPGMLGQVFELFTQAPVSLSRAQGGLGIGLTLVRALVDLHGGRVVAESAGPGRGSSFTVFLPLALKQQLSVAAPAVVPGAKGEDVPLRVLIVDDNEDAAESMAEVLRLMGHHAEVSFSASKALQIAADMDPDLVMLDIGLPEMDGHEVARRLRRLLRPGVRLVAVTGYGADEDRRRSRESGFDEHAVKPVMPEAIAAIVERAARPSVALP